MSVRARQTAFGEVCRPLPYPQSARLLPRLACALNMPLFVQFVQTAQAPPALGLSSKNDVSKIAQICALLRMYQANKKGLVSPCSHTPFPMGEAILKRKIIIELAGVGKDAFTHCGSCIGYSQSQHPIGFWIAYQILIYVLLICTGDA